MQIHFFFLFSFFFFLFSFFFFNFYEIKPFKISLLEGSNIIDRLDENLVVLFWDFQNFGKNKKKIENLKTLWWVTAWNRSKTAYYTCVFCWLDAEISKMVVKKHCSVFLDTSKNISRSLTKIQKKRGLKVYIIFTIIVDINWMTVLFFAFIRLQKKSNMWFFPAFSK